MSQSWRDIATPIVAQVLWDNREKTEKEIRKAIKEAYPFGERRMWPYKVWLNEVRRQRGLLKNRTKQQRDVDGQGVMF